MGQAHQQGRHEDQLEVRPQNRAEDLPLQKELFHAVSELVLPRYTQPAKDLQVLMEKLSLALPAQPPPRITAPTATANL